MVPDILELRAIEDGQEVLYRRCGHLPDLFASRSGSILKLENLSPVKQGAYTVIRYRSNSVSLRTLVADAWLPGWRERGDSLQAVDGDRNNVAPENLQPVSGVRGRPASLVLYRMAEIFQAYRLFPNLKEVADEFGVTIDEVLEAIRFFDAELLPTAREVRELRLRDTLVDGDAFPG